MKMFPNIMVGKQPSDFILIHENVPVFIEAKSSRVKTSFNFSFISENQLEAAESCFNLGIQYYFMIANRSKRRNFKLCVIEGKKMKDLMSGWIRKSIKWPELEEASDLVINRKSSTWMLQEFFEHVRARYNRKEP
jgi:penicillin-binding protein-related factor A (putative recombinase)